MAKSKDKKAKKAKSAADADDIDLNSVFSDFGDDASEEGLLTKVLRDLSDRMDQDGVDRDDPEAVRAWYDRPLDKGSSAEHESDLNASDPIESPKRGITNGRVGDYVRPAQNPKHTMPSDADTILNDILRHRGWARRDGQVKMVDIINDSIANGEPFLDVDIAVNAPVGTGKTLAYLIAGIANGERIVISTSTKGLQDQIMKEELPRLRDDLRELYGYELTYGVLKGKSNYVCARTLEKMLTGTLDDEEESELFDIDVAPDTRDIDVLEQIKDQIVKARATGDSLMFDSEHLIKALTNGTRSSIRASKQCAGKSEPWIDSEEFDDTDLMEGLPDLRHVPCQVAMESACIYRAAYAHAMDSQIVVMNTTLLVYEIMRAGAVMGGALNGLGKPAILRGVGLVIVDEAHHLASIISEAYSVETNFDDIHDSAVKLAKKLNKRYENSSEPGNKFDDIISIVERAEDDIDDADATINKKSAFRAELNTILNRFTREVEAFILRATMFAIKHEKANPSESKKNAAGVPKVVASLLQSFAEEIEPIRAIAQKAIAKDEESGDWYNDIALSDLSDPDAELTIKSTPIDVAFFRSDLASATKIGNPYVAPREDERSIVALSSGTITKRTAQTVGMFEPHYLDVETPFDPKKVRVYVPPIVDPGKPQWQEEAWGEMEQAIRAINGRTIVLTTSVSKLKTFTERARKELAPDGFTIYSQDDYGMTKLQLVDALRNTKKAVLFGTKSFWEGVDIPGPELSLVIIDKIMFPMPDDPFFKARREWVERHGGNPFSEVDVDYASVMLAQGTGRAIRSVSDVAGIMILDHRVLTKGYSSKVTQLLPAKWMVTREWKQFRKFLEYINPDNGNDLDRLPSTPEDYWQPMRKPRPDVRRKITRD